MLVSARTQQRYEQSEYFVWQFAVNFIPLADTKRCYTYGVNVVMLRINDITANAVNDVASPTVLHFVQIYGTIYFINEVTAMKEDKLSDLSMQLSVDVLRLTKELKAKHETVISNQIGRSATSVCANIAESKYGHSRADFIAKLEIALKEANETGKWLEMLLKSDYIDEATYKSINKTCSTIRILLIASIKTAKSKLNKWFMWIFDLFKKKWVVGNEQQN